MSGQSLNFIAVSVFCSAWVTGNGTALAQTCPCPPGDLCDTEGAWCDVLNWPLEGIHMILSKNGKVICIDDLNNLQPVGLYNPIAGLYNA